MFSVSEVWLSVTLLGCVHTERNDDFKFPSKVNVQTQRKAWSRVIASFDGPKACRATKSSASSDKLLNIVTRQVLTLDT